MRIPFISSHQIETGFEACCAVRVASLMNSDLLKDYHYGPAEERSTTSFSKLNPRHLQNGREMLLSAMASMTEVTFEVRISIIPDLVHKAQGDIDMFLMIRCNGESEPEAREKAAAAFLSLFPILVTYLPEADIKLVKSEDELQQCIIPFEVKHASSIVRRTQEIPLASVVVPNNVGFLVNDTKISGQQDVALNHLAPWIPSFDDWGRLLEILAGQMEPTMLLIRLRSRSDVSEERERLNNIVELCEAALAGIETNEFALRKTVSMFEEQTVTRLENLSHPCFDVAALIASSQKISSALAVAFGSAISGRRLGGEEPAWLQGGYDTRDMEHEDFMAATCFPERSPFSIGEAACAFRFPSPPSRDIPGLKVQRFRANLAMLPPELDESPESIRLFLNEFQGMSQPVHIDPDDRMRHCFIQGQTGTGKSSLLEHMIIQDIYAGRGLAVIDPHGDMVDNIINHIPRERAEDLIILDLLDRERPLGFNILQWSTISERDLIIDSLYQHVDHIYDMKTTGGPIFESYFRGALKLLMGDKPREGFVPTLLEFKRCFTDREFRHWLLKSVSDQQIIDFIEEAEAAGGDAQLANIAPYISSKFSRFINDISLQRIIGQEETSFDFDEIINKGKIFLVKMAKGRFGSEVSALLATMLVSRFQAAAMKRGEMPMKDRRDFFLYVDEAHNLPSQNVTELLSEARKYRLGLILATQYCSQLGNVSGSKDDLLAAVFGNVGSLITFRTGSQDADLLSKGFAPYFNSLDIMSLPNYHGYARMNLNNQAMTPFSFRTELNASPEDAELGRRMKVLSRLKYGQDCNIVDATIFRRVYNWKNTDCEKKNVELAPNVVNPIVLQLDYLALDAPRKIDRLLKKHELLTIGDIVHYSDTSLIEKYEFSLEDTQTLSTCLNKLGCCLQESQPFSKKEKPEIDLESDEFLWDDWAINVADSDNTER
ncbi:MAG: type IV secretion system DNA-binding domain-containing protein [Desulfuromonadaceae bacterium]|nr:type IV secretion system DNA-binding domain-containing protein [Desulfuromonadaceae bacterium]